MSDNRLTPELELDGLPTDEAFAVLGNETRLDIVRVLWQSGAMYLYDDVDETTQTIPYSDLRQSVDVEDSGKFNYHLSKLQPHFVTKTDDGYRLSGAGKKIARTVVAVSGTSPDTRAELDVSCPLCESPIQASYDDTWLRFTCTECEGLFGDAAPDGTLLNENFPQAGVASRDVVSAYRTKLYRCILDMLYLMQGICRECASPVEASVTVCDDHVDQHPCNSCGRHSEAWAELRCGTCQFAKRLPVEFCTLGLLPTLAFLYDHGIDLFDPSLQEMVEIVDTQFSLGVSRDPLRLTVTVEGGDEHLVLTLDSTLTLLDCRRRPADV